MLNNSVKPSSLEGIKRLATHIKRSEGVPHAQALDRASVAASFQNFSHARRTLKNGDYKPKADHQIFITVYWRDDMYNKGRETLSMRLSQPIATMTTRAQRAFTRGMSGTRLVAADHLVSDSLARSAEDARGMACKACRSLQFMDVTGLRPSREYRKAYPQGNERNKLPGTDHPTDWYDPATGQYILVDEPYGPPDHYLPEREAWAQQHNWIVLQSSWPGMYYPYNCNMFLATEATGEQVLRAVLSKIDAASRPMIVDNWDGESALSHATFVSPAAISETDAKRAKSKAVVQPRASAKTIPFSLFLAGSRRRPAARMPIEAHQEIGRLLKSVLSKRIGRVGIHGRLETIRCRLDDWVQCEYRRNELADDAFFDLYYLEAPTDARSIVTASTKQDFIAAITNVKSLLKQYYPDCTPVRELYREADKAIAALEKWQAP